jgi:O-antigen ligase
MLGDLALAFYQVFMVAVAAAILFVSTSHRRRIWSGLFLFLMIGTAATTISRSAGLAIVPIVTVLGLLGLKRWRLVIVGLISATGVGIVLLALADKLFLLWNLLSLDEGSAAGHGRLLQDSLILIQQHPLGLGLGTGGTIGQRYVGVGSTLSENWYLQLASEMGILVAATFLVAIVVLGAQCLINYFRLKDLWLRRLSLMIVGTCIGFLIIGNLLHAWENTVLSMLIWLLAGIAVRAPELEREWAAGG